MMTIVTIDLFVSFRDATVKSFFLLQCFDVDLDWYMYCWRAFFSGRNQLRTSIRLLSIQLALAEIRPSQESYFTRNCSALAV